MNTTLFYARYIITVLIAYLSLDEVGPIAGLIVFVIANALWTRGEDSLTNAYNRQQTQNWRNRQ